MKTILKAICIQLLLTTILGVMYPLAVTGLGAIFSRQSGGSLIIKNGQIVGSEWIAQKFILPKYFQPRPSAGDYATLPSGASNAGPTNASFIADVAKRKTALALENPGTPVPSDLLFTSASGLDPHISPEAARFQVARIAIARKLNPEQNASLIQMVSDFVEGPQFGVLGEPRVNVLKLNLALDSNFQTR